MSEGRDAGRGGAPHSIFAKIRGSVRESGGGLTLMTIAASVILVAALAAIPQRGPGGQGGQGKNPAADAEAIRRTLAIQAGERLEAGEATPAASDSTKSLEDASPAFRDLFSTVRIVRQTPARRTRAAPPRLPQLSGVFLDGGNRLAVLDGGTVAEGGDIGGFHVHSILVDKVVLERSGQLYTLDWKGVQP